MEKVHEQEGCTAFVAVGERMVLYDEVQQMRGLGFRAGLSGFAKHALVQITQQ
jgi:hypothetical protein